MKAIVARIEAAIDTYTLAADILVVGMARTWISLPEDPIDFSPLD